MSEAPKLIGLVVNALGEYRLWDSREDARDGAVIQYILTDIADEHKRQRDRLLDVLTTVHRVLTSEAWARWQDAAILTHIRGGTPGWVGERLPVEEIASIIAECDDKPIASGDVQTGEVKTDA